MSSYNSFLESIRNDKSLYNFLTQEDKEKIKEKKKKEVKVFKFSNTQIDLPCSKGAECTLSLNASDDISWSIEPPNGLDFIISPTSGVGSADINFKCKSDMLAYFPKVEELKAIGSYQITDLNANTQETKTVEAVCLLSQETKYNVVENYLSPINNTIAISLQNLIENTPCCADLINASFMWIDNNILSYLSGILDKGISPISDIIGELGEEGEEIAGAISFTEGGVPAINVDTLTDLQSWLTRLLRYFRLYIKFATMSISMYAKAIKQIRAIVADLKKYVIDIPKILTERLLGGGCKAIIDRVAPGISSFLKSMTDMFKTIADMLDPILDLFDKIIAILKEYMFGLGGNMGFLEALRNLLQQIKEKLHNLVAPVAGCEKIVYRS